MKSKIIILLFGALVAITALGQTRSSYVVNDTRILKISIDFIARYKIIELLPLSMPQESALADDNEAIISK